MALNTTQLEIGLKNALKKALDKPPLKYGNSKLSAEIAQMNLDIATAFAKDAAEAIKNFIMSGDVNITQQVAVVTDPGQVTKTSDPVSGAGTTIAPGTGNVQPAKAVGKIT